MRPTTVLAYLWVMMMGMYWIPPTLGSPMSPPQWTSSSTEVKDGDEWKWPSSGEEEGTKEQSQEVSKTEEEEEEEEEGEEEGIEEDLREGRMDMGASQSIFSSFLSPFLGGRQRPGVRVAHRGRDKISARRPPHQFQQHRFPPPQSARFRPPPVHRQPVPNPSPRPHVFTPIISSPVSNINFPAFPQGESTQTLGDFNSFSNLNIKYEENSRPKHGDAVYVPVTGNDYNDETASVREENKSHFSVINPQTLKPSPSTANEPPLNPSLPSQQHASNPSFSNFQESRSPPSFNSGNQFPSSFHSSSSSIRIPSNSQATAGFQGTSKPQSNNGNSLHSNVPSKNNLHGFVSPQNVNDIKSNINVAFQKPFNPFSHTQDSFSFSQNDFFITGNLSDITSSKDGFQLPHKTPQTGAKESRTVAPPFAAFSSTTRVPFSFQTQTPGTPKTQIPLLYRTQPRPSQIPRTFPPTRSIVQLITNAPLKNLSHLNVQYSSPSNQLRATPTPQYQQWTSPTPRDQPSITPEPQRKTQTTPAPWYNYSQVTRTPQNSQQIAQQYQPQSTTPSPQYNRQTTPSQQYNSQRVSSRPQHPPVPEYRSQPPNVQIKHQSQPQDLPTQQVTSTPEDLQGGNELTLRHQDQANLNQFNSLRDFNQNEVKSPDDSFGFIPFASSDDFFNHIFGNENPFGDKIPKKDSTGNFLTSPTPMFQTVNGNSSPFHQQERVSQPQESVTRPYRQTQPTINTPSAVPAHQNQPFVTTFPSATPPTSTIGHNGFSSTFSSHSSQFPDLSSHSTNPFFSTASPSVTPFRTTVFQQPFSTPSGRPSSIPVTSQQTVSSALPFINLVKESSISFSPIQSWKPVERLELQTQPNDQETSSNTDSPRRTAIPFTISEGGENPYTSSPSSQDLLNPQTSGSFEFESDVPSTISATTTIDDKEFEVLVLPYKDRETQEEKSLLPFNSLNDQNGFIKSAPPLPPPPPPPPTAQEPFQAGLPIQPSEEEVSVYLVRHRLPSTSSGGSPTPPVVLSLPSAAPASFGDLISNNNNNNNNGRGDATFFGNTFDDFGKDAVEFRGFPVPVELTVRDEERSSETSTFNSFSTTLTESSSSSSGSRQPASSRQFKFDYEDNGDTVISNVPHSLEGSFDPQGFDPSRDFDTSDSQDLPFEFTGLQSVGRPFQEPDEYVQVLGLLAPPPGVVCDHGFCEEESALQKK